jgi:exosome complex exonuclease RRP6
MFYYARSDTHYLLYIYDMLRNELAELSGQYHPNGKPIDRVLAKSREVALQRYEYPLCDLETGAGSRGWFNTLVKAPTLYNGEQFAVYKAVHKWRDDLARREDESPYFFMTQQVLSDIARIIPTDKKALWSLLDSQARGLKAHLDSLFDVIQEAKAKGANGPTMLQFFEQSSTAAAGQTPLGDSSAKVRVQVDGEPLSIQELKSEHSQLWGSMALSSAWDGSIRTDTLDEQVEIPFPYSEVTFSILGAEEEIQPSQKVAEEPDAAATSAREEEPEFTLKGGRKRKAREAEFEPESEPESDPGQQQPPSSGGDDSEPDDAEMGGTSAAASPSASEDKVSDEAHKKAKGKLTREELEALRKQGKEAGRELIRLKREERAAKKAAREQKRLEKQQKKQQKQQQQQASGASVEEGEQQFDYSKAQSVLHAPRDAGGGGGSANGTKGRKAAFDPYTKKSGDAPQGARKMNYEKGGRTATFKS